MKTINVAVVGIGFIGLPLALSYAMKGARVIGLDVSEPLITDINNGESHHLEYDNGKSLREILQEQLASGHFRGTTSYEEAAGEVDHYIITVGVDVKDGKPATENLKAAMTDLAKVIKKGDTVLVRSTVVPGTTEEVVKPILESSGLTVGEDIYLGYSSERIAEGRAFDEFRTMPLAVGGVNETSLKKCRALLEVVTEADIRETSITIVEAAKVIENVQRDVNIAMVQEIARLSEAMGVDTQELIQTANTHKRVQLLIPGPGVGGYCLPNALYYLLPKAEEHDVNLSLLRKARQINDLVPQHIVTSVKNKLEESGKSLKGAKVAVLGLAMKDFSNDDRISPPHDIVELFLEFGADVHAYDPAVPSRYEYKTDSLDEAVADADVLVYLTVQEAFVEYDFKDIVTRMADNPVLFDAKNRIPLSLRESVTLLRL